MYFITGANGLVGCYVVTELLKQDSKIICGVRTDQSKQQLIADVCVLSKLSRTDLENRLTFAIGDIMDDVYLREQFTSETTVIHAAANVSFDPKDRDQLFETNAQGTENVVNACLHAKVNKLCYISSVAAIGRTGSTEMITEETVWEDSKKNTNYAISKRFAELEVWRGSEEGLNMVMVNPTVILGYTSQGNSSSSIFYNIKKGFPFKSKGTNGFVGAADVAKIAIALANSEIINERFVLCGENMHFDHLFGLIADGLGKPKAKIEVKRWMKYFVLPIAWLLSKLTGKAPFVTPEVFSTSLSVNQYSADKIKDQLGFEFTPIAQVVDEVTGMMS